MLFLAVFTKKVDKCSSGRINIMHHYIIFKQCNTVEKYFCNDHSVSMSICFCMSVKNVSVRTQHLHSKLLK